MHADHHYYYHCCYHSAICGATRLSLSLTHSAAVPTPTHPPSHTHFSGSCHHRFIVAWVAALSIGRLNWQRIKFTLWHTAFKYWEFLSSLFLSLSFRFFCSFISSIVFRQFKFWYAKMSGGMWALDRHHWRMAMNTSCALLPIYSMFGARARTVGCWKWRN